tara:strand:+ start:557 stop:1096 length:540 start_codon:yes stop_codon:yes gene_type:complete
MQQETIIIISLAITVFFIIFLSITFMNRKSKCKEGEFSLDGKGSFFDPCAKCADPKEDPVTLVKEIPIGAYQCPMGDFDDKINSGIDLLVGMADSIPNPFDQGSNSSSQCGMEFSRYNGPTMGGDVDFVEAALTDAVPSCTIQRKPYSSFNDSNFQADIDSVVLFHDDDGKVREVRLTL